MHHDAAHTNKTIGLIVTVVVLLAVASLFIFGSASGIRAELTETALHVKGPMFEETVALSDIDSAELQQDVAYGSRTWGADFVSVKTGNFQNTAFGSYRCAVYSGPQSCIVVRHTGGTLVFNLKTDGETQTFFHQLQAALQ